MTLRPLMSALALSLMLAACGGKDDHADDHGSEAGHGEEEAVRGEHGGRLLEQDGYRVELAIAESGTPPTYQAWLYRDGNPLPATAGRVEVSLVRLGNVRENHILQPQPDGSLLAKSVVGEPHSFDVEVLAKVEGKSLRWAYDSYEGRTTIGAKIAEDSGIRVAPVQAGTIADEHEVQGLLTPVEGRVAQVAARFPGPVRGLDAEIGDRVRAGQRLATIESNLSLSSYAVTAPIAGTVLARSASVGGVAAEGAPLYEIADLSTLWVDLHVFGADATHIGAGAPVVVTRLADGATARSTIARVLPGTATASQSTIARAVIDNGDGAWRPGSAVRARITVALAEVALAVPLAALQELDGLAVVFVREGERYRARAVATGRRDASRTEVLSGIEAGDEVVVEQSFVVKADIEKAGAGHDH